MRIGSPAPSTPSPPLIFSLHTPHLTRPPSARKISLASLEPDNPDSSSIHSSILEDPPAGKLGDRSVLGER